MSSKKKTLKISVSEATHDMLARQQFIAAYLLGDNAALSQYENVEDTYNAFMRLAGTFDPNDFHFEYFSTSIWVPTEVETLEDTIVNYGYSAEVASKILGRTVDEVKDRIKDILVVKGEIRQNIKDEIKQNIRFDNLDVAGNSQLQPQTIEQHEGKKYLRKIRPAIVGGPSIMVDVYCVCDAFGVTDAAIAHAIKKLLCPGVRGKGDKLADLTGAIAALNRAVEIEQQRINDD